MHRTSQYRNSVLPDMFKLVQLEPHCTKTTPTRQPQPPCVGTTRPCPFSWLASGWLVSLLECFLIITACKQSCGKIMFLHPFVCYSVHKGRCTLSLWTDNPPSGRHPPRQTPPIPPLQWTVRILLECILVFFIQTDLVFNFISGLNPFSSVECVCVICIVFVYKDPS